MFEKVRSPPRRDLRPSLDPLEERALLNAAPLQLERRVSAPRLCRETSLP